MFNIHEVKGTKKVSTGEFLTIPYQTIPMKQLSVNYSNIYIYLTTNSDEGQSNVYGLPFERIPYSIRTSDTTIEHYLSTLVENSIPQLDFIPKYPTTKYLKYFSAWPYFEETILGNINHHIDTELTEDLKDDLWIRTKLPLSDFKANVLMTAGGLIHKVTYGDDVAAIIGSVRTLLRSNCNSLGILDFTDLGGINQVSITKDNISRPSPESKLVNGTYVKLPFTLQGKTPYLVLGGKFITSGEILKVVSDDIVKINMSSIDLVHAYHTLEARTDALLDVDINSAGAVVNSSLQEDKFIESLLISNLSFIAVVNSEGLSRDISRLSDSQLPGVYYNAQANLPVLYGNGYLADYNVSQVDVKGVSIQCYQYMTDQPLRFTGDPDREVVSKPQNISVLPSKYSSASQLYITKQVME